MQPGASKAKRIVVNGQPTDTEAATLADLVALLGFGRQTVATAHNGDFVARDAREKVMLAADDAVEIVSPRQGG
jgi:sulfur carrier protein